MLARTLGNIFKIILLTLTICMFSTIIMLAIDAFTCINRVQNITDFVEYDIAQNNCMMNSTYMMYLTELASASDKSTNMQLCTGDVGNVQLGTRDDGTPLTIEGTQKVHAPVAAAGGNIGRTPVQLWRGGDVASRDFIQVNDTQKGILKTETSIKTDDEFYVANYGDILNLRVNLVLYPAIFTFSRNQDGSAGVSMNDFGYAVWAFPIELNWHIPALAYIKA